MNNHFERSPSTGEMIATAIFMLGRVVFAGLSILGLSIAVLVTVVAGYRLVNPQSGGEVALAALLWAAFALPLLMFGWICWCAFKRAKARSASFYFFAVVGVVFPFVAWRAIEVLFSGFRVG